MSKRRQRYNQQKHQVQAEANCELDYYSDSDEEQTIYAAAYSMGQFFLNPCHGIFMCLQRCCLKIWKQWQPKQRNQRQQRIIHSNNQQQNFSRKAWSQGSLGMLLLFFFSMAALLSWIPIPMTIHKQSPPTRPILIKLYDFASQQDECGGWMYPSPFQTWENYRKRSDTLSRQPLNATDASAVDFGGLRMAKLSPKRFRRRIPLNAIEVENAHRARLLEEMDEAEYVGRKYWHDEELDAQVCRRPKWFSSYYPNCNTFHEMDLGRSFDTNIMPFRLGERNVDSYIFSNGYYRDAWLVEFMGTPRSRNGIHRAVLKTLRYTHDFSIKTMRMAQRDAVVMEQLTDSKYIINMYGHCAHSILVEAIEYEFERYIVPNGGYALDTEEQAKLHDEDGVHPRNDYSGVEKLEMALAMSESLAELHGFRGGTIVHNDVQLCQWLRSKETGSLIFGDFNRAEIMLWNDIQNQYCKYNLGSAYGNYRSPEEYSARDLNEQIDVFSMGNNFYALLTGLWPFYTNEDDGVVQKFVMDGQTSFIDDLYRTYSYGDGKLVEIIEQMWAYKPEDRPTIFQVVDFLRKHFRIAQELEAKEA